MLETWEAERFEEIKEGGRTRPLVIEGSFVPPEKVDKITDIFSASKRLMLVKSRNAEVTEVHLFSELFGNLIAREFGVFTPRPARVRISAEFVAALKLSAITQHIKIEPEYGIGCEFLSGLAPLANFATSNSSELPDMQAIFGADMLMQNPDRRSQKPNCASFRGRHLAFDFELAFSFLLPLFGEQPPAWAIDQQGFHQNHLFYRELKRRQADLDWTPFLKHFEVLMRGRAQEILASAPAHWSAYAEKVSVHLSEVYANLPRFRDALIRSNLKTFVIWYNSRHGNSKTVSFRPDGSPI